MNSYKVIFRFYDIAPKTAYIEAENQGRAFEKAHAFISPADDCCEIIPERVRKADVPEYTKPCRIRGWEREALCYAEDIGVYEYTVIGNAMEYWTLYEDGFWFVRHNLETQQDEVRELRIPWTGKGCVPGFLIGKTGGTLYNYMIG